MKAFLSFAVVSSTLLFLTACASTGTAYEKAPMKHESRATDDNTYVTMVERIARQRGIQVMWVNPPKKRVVEPVATAQ